MCTAIGHILFSLSQLVGLEMVVTIGNSSSLYVVLIPFLISNLRSSCVNVVQDQAASEEQHFEVDDCESHFLGGSP